MPVLFQTRVLSTVQGRVKYCLSSAGHLLSPDVLVCKDSTGPASRRWACAQRPWCSLSSGAGVPTHQCSCGAEQWSPKTPGRVPRACGCVGSHGKGDFADEQIKDLGTDLDNPQLTRGTQCEPKGSLPGEGEEEGQRVEGEHERPMTEWLGSLPQRGLDRPAGQAQRE